jgi:hypothetical protein
MDEGLFHRVMSALRATHSPFTTQHDRGLAYSELESFKQVMDKVPFLRHFKQTIIWNLAHRWA